MVQEWAEMAYGMRRPNQRLETPSWTCALSLSWRGRNAALGWAWSDRRQPNQHRQTPGPGIGVKPHHPTGRWGRNTPNPPILHLPKVFDGGIAPPKHTISHR